ncbi:MAG: Gfo/Idh/MocA family oxidoreductase [Planctomycetes bacterium]|nr:Gfo/Idh/MocA family oxidoreductase [Planctomycetota bacterium]
MHTSTRRSFLRTTGAAAASALIVSPSAVWSYAANEKLRFACIGAGGMAHRGIMNAMSEHLVAVAEVDPEGVGRQQAEILQNVKKEFPDSAVYTDYRRLFDANHKLDVVWVGVPDHNHFGAAIRALEAGANVYCEKPLVHDVYETRKIREVAKAKNLVTQMGNQGHSSDSLRLLCEFVWQGSLGDVTEVHVKNSNDYANYGGLSKAEVPKGMNWDAWLGPAPEHEYVARSKGGGLHHIGWRGWLEYGTGMLGDWFCHNGDGAVWALKLNEAETVEVEAESGKPTAENYPKQAKVVWRFPKRGDVGPVTLRWFQNMALPRPPALEPGREAKDLASVYYGSKGMAVAGAWMDGVRLIPESFQQQVGRPKEALPRIRKSGKKYENVSARSRPLPHHEDFLDAIREGRKSCADFDYSARLTEIMLLGNVALRAGEKFTYDFRAGKCNSDKANALLRRDPRKGWEFGYV